MICGPDEVWTYPSSRSSWGRMSWCDAGMGIGNVNLRNHELATVHFTCWSDQVGQTDRPRVDRRVREDLVNVLRVTHGSGSACQRWEHGLGQRV